MVPYMMMPGDEKMVADRLYEVLSKPPKFENPPAPQAPSVTVAGQWVATWNMGGASAVHHIVFEQAAEKLTGTHHAEFDAGDLSGTVSGNAVKFQSRYRIQGQGLSYAFTGTVDGDKMSGTVNWANTERRSGRRRGTSIRRGCGGERDGRAWPAPRGRYRAATAGSGFFVARAISLTTNVEPSPGMLVTSIDPP